MERKIIDVSVHNGVIDWETVKNNIDGAILRCGFGSDVLAQDDKYWKRNADECTRLGIPFGVYLYSYAETLEKAKSEAEHVLRLVKGYKLDYPIYYDLEENDTQENAVERSLLFGDMIESAGYWCGIYANEYWFNHYIGDKLDKYTKWVAKYSVNKPNVNDYDIWQYSSKATVNGINGFVDINYCYRDFPSEINPKKEQSNANVIPESNVSPIPEKEEVKEEPVITLSKECKWKGEVTDDSVNVRTWAGTEYDTCYFSPLNNGTIVEVCDTVKANNGRDWYYIKYNNGYGFISSGYVKEYKEISYDIDYASCQDKSMQNGKYFTTTDDLNLRTGANINKKVICVIPRGSKVKTYGYYSVFNGRRWYYVVYGDKKGFVSSGYLK